MDPRTLPDRERALYDTIHARYKVAFESLRMGGRRLHLLKATDLEQLLGGKDPLKNPSEFPFWIKLWEAAMVLALYLGGQEGRGRTLLELGAGLGAPGLAAASAGFQVTLSDYEELILDFERVSAGANGLDKVDFLRLDWLEPPADLPRFDLIVGAEVLFRDDFFEPLLRIFLDHLAPGGEILLAHDIERQSVPAFLRLAEPHFHIAASRREMRSLEGDKVVLLNRLVRRGG